MRTLFIVAALLIAGCSDNSAPATPDGDLLSGPDVETDDDTGAITGVVVSATIMPIPGATVTLVGQGREVVTDDSGQFVFEDVAPGLYFVSASAPDFIATQSGADVQAGAVTKVRIQLQQDMTPKPYHNTIQFQGHMVISDFVVAWQLTTVLGQNDICECYFEFTSDPNVKTIVVEAVWESSTARVEPHDMWWDLWGGDGYDGQWVEPYDAWHASGETFGADVTEWIVQISSGEQPDVEQDFEGFVTFWHVEPAPSGWSVTGGAP